MYSRSTITEQKLTPSAKRAQTQTELNELPLCSLYGKGTSTKARNDLVNRPQYYPNPNPNPQKQNCTNTHRYTDTQLQDSLSRCCAIRGAMFADCNFCQHFIFDHYCTDVHLYCWGMARGHHAWNINANFLKSCWKERGTYRHSGSHTCFPSLPISVFYITGGCLP